MSYDILDAEFLRKNRNLLDNNEWRRISENYRFKIDFSLLTEFQDRFSRRELLNNENLDWNDYRLLSFFISGRTWQIYKCYHLWEKLFSPYVTVQNFPYCFDAIKSLEKHFQVNAKFMTENKDEFKYIIAQYAKSDLESLHQMIGSDYFLSKVNLEVGFIFVDFKDIS